MKLCLNCKFTDGKRVFKVIGVEFRPIEPERKRCDVYYEFEEVGAGPPKISLRESTYMNGLLESGKIKYIE